MQVRQMHLLMVSTFGREERLSAANRMSTTRREPDQMKSSVAWTLPRANQKQSTKSAKTLWCPIVTEATKVAL